MKKYLKAALTATMILGSSLTASAANPFTDVPSNHWAYASISKLAQAGIIEGYGDGRFIGNNTMTRFEMAQIVAKAMAKADSQDMAQRAQIEKLAAEFADELDSLGVRVANLEKNADNVKMRGEVRFGNFDYDKNVAGSDASKIRSRLWLTGQVNERWAYGGMLENNGHNFKTNAREDSISLRRAWVEGYLGSVHVTAGRFAYTPVFGIVYDNDGDGIKFSYKTGKLSLDAFAMRPSFSNYTNPQNATAFKGNNQVLGGQLGYNFDKKLNMQVAYYNLDGRDDNTFDADIIEAGLSYKVVKNVELWGEYIRGGNSMDNHSVSRNGYAGGVKLGMPDRSKAGTWGLRAAYYDVPAAGNIATTVDLDMTPFGDGFKGYQVGATWVPMKNINFNIDYYDYKTQGEVYTDKLKDKLLFSYVRFYF